VVLWRVSAGVACPPASPGLCRSYPKEDGRPCEQRGRASVPNVVPQHVPRTQRCRLLEDRPVEQENVTKESKATRKILTRSPLLPSRMLQGGVDRSLQRPWNPAALPPTNGKCSLRNGLRTRARTRQLAAVHRTRSGARMLCVWAAEGDDTHEHRKTLRLDVAAGTRKY
jgi:hypothetical protein